MNTKLTLRMEEVAVETAKAEARRRGKSVSQMVEDFFDVLKTGRGKVRPLPPTTASLLGLLKGKRVSEAAYKKHLKEKHL